MSGVSIIPVYESPNATRCRIRILGRNPMKILILFFFVLLLQVNYSEAEQIPWLYFMPIDEMTGKERVSAEKVVSSVDVENSSFRAALMVFCSNEINFSINDLGNPNFNLRSGISGPLRIKFDNNPPFTMVGVFFDNVPDTVFFIKDDYKLLIRGMRKHYRVWVEFTYQNVPKIAKFDLTGFSRELAKCRNIPL